MEVRHRSVCPNCKRALLTTTGADTVNRVVYVVCVHCGHILKTLSDREVAAARGPLVSKPIDFEKQERVAQILNRVTVAGLNAKLRGES